MRTPKILAAGAVAALLVFLALCFTTPQAAAPARAAASEDVRQGAWLDSIAFTEVLTPADAVALLQANALDLFASPVGDAALFQAVLEDPFLAQAEEYGFSHELTLNPVGPEFNDGRLNPFSSAAIRTALNRLVDRGQIVEAILGGQATPRWVPLSPVGTDHARFLGAIRALEAEYAYDPEAAAQAIAAEMQAMGAILEEGVWYYDGQPVTLIFLMRTEDERRLAIGNYVADRLEWAGFAVDRVYCTSQQCGALWRDGDPAEGLWHIYTGGWLTTFVNRDEATSFGSFYTPFGLPWPLWQAYQPSPEFTALCEALWNGTFSGMEERAALFEQALGMALGDPGSGSVRVWLADRLSMEPRLASTVVSGQPAGQMALAPAWPHVARFRGITGGTMRIAQPGLVVEPWNPVAGSTWVYDLMPILATQDHDFLPDVYSGLYWPQRAASAQVVVRQGLPVTRTLDWIDLSFTPEIAVPDDAWVDWDAAEERFVTAAEKYTQTVTANFKVTVTYPPDLFTAVTWHDGSPLDVADFVLRVILQFDRAKPESALYDESYLYDYDAFMQHFRGVQIESLDPLVITTYDDRWLLDAELVAAGVSPDTGERWTWWPSYAAGPGAWHALAVGARAEAAGELAFGSLKAAGLGVEWTSYILGPSLPILEGWMDQSAAESYVPYEPTLGDYLTYSEVDERWANLQAWYEARGHFWLGTGPFYLEAVSAGPKSVTLQRYPAFPDAAGRWDAFAAYRPVLAIDHDSGAPGSFFAVTGSGFPPGSRVEIAANGTALGALEADGSGGVAFQLSTGGAAEGEYHLRARAGQVAGLPFTLDAAQPAWPRAPGLPALPLVPGHYTYLYLPAALRDY